MRLRRLPTGMPPGGGRQRLAWPGRRLCGVGDAGLQSAEQGMNSDLCSAVASVYTVGSREASNQQSQCCERGSAVNSRNAVRLSPTSPQVQITLCMHDDASLARTPLDAFSPDAFSDFTYDRSIHPGSSSDPFHDGRRHPRDSPACVSRQGNAAGIRAAGCHHTDGFAPTPSPVILL